MRQDERLGRHLGLRGWTYLAALRLPSTPEQHSHGIGIVVAGAAPFTCERGVGADVGRTWRILFAQPAYCLVVLVIVALATEQQVLLLLHPADRGRDSETGATPGLLLGHEDQKHVLFVGGASSLLCATVSRRNFNHAFVLLFLS